MTSYSWNNANGGNWGTNTNWTSTGVPGAADSATVGLAGTYQVSIAAPASVHTLSVTDATATVDDSTSLTLPTLGGLAGTFTLTAGKFILDNGGTLAGGVVNVNGGSFLVDAGVLDGVTFEGLLNMSASLAFLTVVDGIVLKGAGGTGAATINLTGRGSHLWADDTTTVDNARINIGYNGTSASDTSVLQAEDTTGTGQVLTLGPHLNIVQTGKYATIGSSSYAGDGIVNQGSIIAGLNGSTLAISTPSFANQGTLVAKNGGTIDLQTNIPVGGLGKFSTATDGAVVLNSTLSNTVGNADARDRKSA